MTSLWFLIFNGYMEFQCIQFIQLTKYQGDLDCEEIYENLYS